MNFSFLFGWSMKCWHHQKYVYALSGFFLLKGARRPYICLSVPRYRIWYKLQLLQRAENTWKCTKRTLNTAVKSGSWVITPTDHPTNFPPLPYWRLSVVQWENTPIFSVLRWNSFNLHHSYSWGPMFDDCQLCWFVGM